MDLKAIQALSHEDMQAVNLMIQQQLSSEVVLINQLGNYIIAGGGKRVRPMLTVLMARALGYDQKDHIDLAAIVEFIHTATLLHDDVVDESDLRRGRDTANAVFGNAASVLVGDFLYSRSFQMMTRMQNLRVMDILSDATNVIAEGEVMQLMNCNDPDTTIDNYLNVIYCKTAKLFEASTRLPAVLTGESESVEESLAAYGKYLGTAFQLFDDYMDYAGNADAMGKNVGDDLAEGKPTLPLLYAIQQTQGEDRQLVRDAIEHANGMENFDRIMAILEQTRALEYTLEQAKEEANKAIKCLEVLPESEHKKALTSLAFLSVNRDS